MLKKSTGRIGLQPPLPRRTDMSEWAQKAQMAMQTIRGCAGTK